MTAYTELAALLIVGVVFMLDRFGLLPKKKTTVDYDAEVKFRDQKIERLEAANVSLTAANVKLEGKTSLEPILDKLNANAELQAQVLDRLVHHNGSFKEMHRQMQLLTEGVQMVVGFIAELHGLPVKPPPAPVHRREQ